MGYTRSYFTSPNARTSMLCHVETLALEREGIVSIVPPFGSDASGGCTTTFFVPTLVAETPRPSRTARSTSYETGCNGM